RYIRRMLASAGPSSRRVRCTTQIELAERIGLIQSLVCDYEKDRLRLSAEMALRFALALDVTVDELRRPKHSKAVGKLPSRRVLRRLEKINTAPGSSAERRAPEHRSLLKGLAS